MAPCIQLSQVTKRYADTVAVDALSLEVEPGEVMGLLGPNGAGKTTTLCVLTGLVRPDAGAVRLFGKELAKHFIEIAGRMGVLVERPAFMITSRLAGI